MDRVPPVVEPQGRMLRIRFITPAVMDEDGWSHAGAELVVGTTRLCFLVDLSHWGVGDYMQQWRAGLDRLLDGAPSTALMTAYRGPGGAAHVMWALWRDETSAYVQEHSVLPTDLDAPFAPAAPYAHVGARIPAAEGGLPIPEWHVSLAQLPATLRPLRPLRPHAD